MDCIFDILSVYCIYSYLLNGFILIAFACFDFDMLHDLFSTTLVILVFLLSPIGILYTICTFIYSIIYRLFIE